MTSERVALIAGEPTTDEDYLVCDFVVQLPDADVETFTEIVQSQARFVVSRVRSFAQEAGDTEFEYQETEDADNPLFAPDVYGIQVRAASEKALVRALSL